MSDPTPADAPADAAPAQITIDDFLKLDLRVATVKEAEAHPDADRLLVLTLDDGTPDGRQICAGLRATYAPEDLVGRQVVVVANLAPRKMRGQVSQGMLLAAGEGEHVAVLSPVTPVPAGSRVG